MPNASMANYIFPFADPRDALIDSLQRENAKLRAELESARLTQRPGVSVANDVPVRPRMRLADPVRFTGERSTLRRWKRAMEEKLEKDAAALGGRAAQFEYVYSRLDKSVRDVTATFYAQEHEYGTASDFLAHLDKVYGDPGREQRALTAVQNLCQRPGQAFASFLAGFERLIVQSGSDNWTDRTKLAALERSMNPELRFLIRLRGAPKSYVDYVNEALSFASDLDDNYTIPVLGSIDTPSHHPAKAGPSASNAMDKKPALTTYARKSCAFGDEQNCYRCNLPGHIARNCLAKKPAESRRGRAH